MGVKALLLGSLRVPVQPSDLLEFYNWPVRIRSENKSKSNKDWSNFDQHLVKVGVL